MLASGRRGAAAETRAAAKLLTVNRKVSSLAAARRYIKRIIEVDDATAAALESRAAEVGPSVSELVAKMIARHNEPAEASPSDIADLDRQWAAIKAGEPTVPHEDVVRWIDTWGTPGFQPWKGR